MSFYSLLSNDTPLLTSGIDPHTGNARAVAILNQVSQNQRFPYVRVTLSDEIPLSEETHGEPQAGEVHHDTLFLAIDVFSDHEPEVWSITARLKDLLRHAKLSGSGFVGYTWLDSVDYFTDNQSDPNKIIRRASMRVRVHALKT